MIYILEDDDSIRKLLAYALKNQGYEAEGFEKPTDFWGAMQKSVPELILLDRMLPEEDGMTVLHRLRSRRETANIPVIILTAKGQEYERVEGLDAGADDYIVKPFGMMELLARVRAVLRRREPERFSKDYRIGQLFLSPERRRVAVAGEEVSLTNKEFTLLWLFAENEGRVLTRSFLMDRVWDLGDEPENRTLDVHIRTLRSKLGEYGANIETVRGVGYRLKSEAEAE